MSKRRRTVSIIIATLMIISIIVFAMLPLLTASSGSYF
jgi:hypothetical protein